MKNLIKKIIGKIIWGAYNDSDSLVRWLKSVGVTVGERVTFFAPHSVLIDTTRPYLISIGNDVQITSGVTILTHGYDWSVIKGIDGDVLGSAGEVIIGNNVFIGVNTTILKDTHIGNNVIIGAGSLINSDIPDNSVVVGNPAKVIWDIEQYKAKRVEAQFREAEVLVHRYRYIYNAEPEEKDLSEFFWLYTGEGDEYEKISEEYKKKMRLLGNENQSKERLNNNHKKFKNFDDFLKHIF